MQSIGAASIAREQSPFAHSHVTAVAAMNPVTFNA
jgi:hypothetical protein